MIWTIAKYEVVRMLKVKSVLVNMLVLPLLLIFILGSALKSTFDMAPVGQIHAGLVNLDSRQAEESLGRFLESSEVKERLAVTNVSSLEELKEQIKEQKLDYGMVIPSDFTKNLQAGKETEWQYFQGTDSVHNLTAKSLLDVYLSKVNQARSLSLVLEPEQAAVAMALSSSGNFDFVKQGNLSSSKEGYSAIQYYAVSMMIMFLMYSGMSMSISLVTEKENHTLARLQSLPLKPNAVLFGKILGNGFLGVLQALIIIGFSHYVFGVYWGNQPLLLILCCIALVIASLSLGAAVAFLTRYSTSVKMILQFVIIIMTFVSGGFSPMPSDVMKTLSLFSINHWGMQSLLRLMLNMDGGQILSQITMLGLISLVLILLAMFAYRRVGYHE